MTQQQIDSQVGQAQRENLELKVQREHLKYKTGKCARMLRELSNRVALYSNGVVEVYQPEMFAAVNPAFMRDLESTMVELERITQEVHRIEAYLAAVTN